MDMDRRSFIASAAALALVPAAFPAPLRPRAALNVGIIGYGRQGRKIAIELLDKLPEAARIAAVCDSTESRAQGATSRAKGAEVFTDHRAMLDKAKALDAVFIATPTHLHKQIALDCIGAGKHIYCEAPLAHTVDDCLAIAKAARGASTVFAAGLEGRSNPIYQLARTFFKSDAVRDMVSLYAQQHQKSTWGKVGDWWLDPAHSLGLPGEWGVHQFDVFHWYRGTFPVSVEGRGSLRFNQDGREVPDTVRCTLRWPDGIELAYDATLANSFGGRFEVLQGTNAAIKLSWTHGWMFKEADAPTQGWEVYANRQQFHNDEGITLIADATKLASQGKLKEGVGLPESSLHYSVAGFLRSVADKAPVAASASEAARSTIVAIMAAQAVKSGQAVAIDPEVLKGA